MGQDQSHPLKCLICGIDIPLPSISLGVAIPKHRGDEGYLLYVVLGRWNAAAINTSQTQLNLFVSLPAMLTCSNNGISSRHISTEKTNANNCLQHL